MVDESAVISFRINKETKKLLETESELKNVTVNQILNNIISKHLKWDRFAKEIGLIFISKSIFRNILTKLSEEEIRLLATTICRDTIKDATIFMHGDFNYENLIDVIDIWITNSHIPFRRLQTDENNVKYIIQHGLGLKYSTYLFTATAILLQELGYTTQNKKLEDQSLTFEICKRNDPVLTKL